MKKKIRSAISFVLVFVMLLASFPLTSVLANTSPEKVSDIEGHWAKDVIGKWTELGLVKGYGDGSFRPDTPVTRAEFMTMANRAFAYSKEGTVLFTDVSSEDWFYGAVVSAADYISGYPDNTMRPNNSISRQEVAKILASIAHLKVGDGAFDETSFRDASSFPAWSRGAIGASWAKAFVKGYPDGSFRPLASITRAEALKALDNTMIKVSLISKAGTIEDATYQGDLVIAHDQVTLNDVIVEGDLIIGEEVGEGDVYLNDVTVRGDTFVRGGGLNSVYINGGDYKKVVVEKSGSGVRLVCTNNDGVEVSLDLPDSEVVLEGDFDKVEVKTEGITLSFQGETTVGELKIDEKASNTQVKTKEKVVLKKAVVESKTDFTGQGTIDEAEGEGAEDSSFEKEPDVVNDVVTTPEKPSGGGSRRVSVSSINLSPESLVLAVYDEIRLVERINPSGATNKKVKWSTDNPKVAAVKEGLVSGLTAGQATIKATSLDGGYSASTVVTVKTPSPDDYFIFDAETGTISGMDWDKLGDDLDIVIPAKIGQVQVQAIGIEAFYKGGLTSVIIPNSVTRIDESAFAQNGLESVRIPDSVTRIGESAFAQNGLESVTIPKSLRSVDKGVFSFNNLTSITIPRSVTSIDMLAFAGNQFTSITLPPLLTTIGQGAFMVNQLEALEIPGSVETIEDAAFAGNKLERIRLAKSIKTIGAMAFNDNQLAEEQAFIYARNEDGSEDRTRLVSYGGAKREDVSLPATVETLGKGAFAENALVSINLGSSLKTIEEEAFRYNTLTELIIPDSVTRIGSRAFNASGLVSVTLPKTLTEIADNAFSANSLKTVSIPDSVKSIGASAFFNNDLTEVVVPNSVSTIGNQAFNNNDLTDVTLPKTLTTIAEGAFAHNELTSISIPNAVTSIGVNAFFSNKLSQVTIPNAVEKIESYAFSSNQLEEVILANSVKSIDSYAFYENILSQITLPASLKSLGKYVFDFNGPGRESGGIPTSEFVGSWQIVEGSEEWIKKIAVTSITVKGENDASSITIDQGGLQMEAIVTPDKATNKTVLWSVTNEDGSQTDKATIDKDGLLKALKNGSVKVTATSEDEPSISGATTLTISNQTTTP